VRALLKDVVFACDKKIKKRFTKPLPGFNVPAHAVETTPAERSDTGGRPVMDNMISLDHSLFIQLANFLVTIIVLNFLLIKPVRRQLAERKTLKERLASEAEACAGLSADKLLGYETALAGARAAAVQSREAIKAESELLQREIAEKAGNAASEYLLSSRRICASECKAAADTLLAGTDRFASLVVRKILD
jgi:F-type H+-transporting ATPase subunit b